MGRDKTNKFWRVLKIDRSEPSDLVLCEDPTVYSYHECRTLLERIHEGNRCTGGLRIVTTCYGIVGKWILCVLFINGNVPHEIMTKLYGFHPCVGFIKFLGPYHMILITERRKVGMIWGHAIYAVSKSKMIPIPHSTVRSNLDNSKKENRSFAHSACKC